MKNWNFPNIEDEKPRIKFVPYTVNFVTPFKSSEGVIYQRKGALVRVALGSLVGYGEASPLPGYSRDTLEKVLEELDFFAKSRLSAQELLTYSALPSVRFAFSTALADLHGKLECKPLREILSSEPSSSVRISQLGDSSIEIPLTKLKISPDNRLEVVEKMTKFPASRFRLDANRTFSFEESVSFFKKVSKFRIEFVEEPFRNPSKDQLGKFSENTGLRVALDESLYLRDCNLEFLLSSDAVAALVIKPCFLGSIQQTIEASSLAKKYARKVIFSSGFDFYFGMACNIQLAAALSGDEDAGLDTFKYFSLPKELPSVGWSKPSIECNDLSGLGLGRKAEEIFKFFEKRAFAEKHLGYA